VLFKNCPWYSCCPLEQSAMCGSRKYPYPHHRGSLGNSEEEGGGALKVKIFKGMYAGAKLEFPEGWGFKPKNPLWGE